MDNVAQLFATQPRAFYSRFGDGDVYIMMGKDQANHKASPALTQEMIESFNIVHPLYLKGLAVNHPIEPGMVRGLFAVFRDNADMQNFLEDTFGALGQKSFENPVFLHYLAVFQPQAVNAFMDEVIRPKRKMFIGSVPKEKVEQLIGPVAHYIQTPAKNSYAEINRWWPEVIKHLNDVELVIPAAGMATRVINKRLWESGVTVQSFDIGSLVDIADDRLTRKWIRLAGHRIEKHILNRKLSIFQYIKKELYLRFYTVIKSVF